MSKPRESCDGCDSDDYDIHTCGKPGLEAAPRWKKADSLPELEDDLRSRLGNLPSLTLDQSMSLMAVLSSKSSLAFNVLVFGDPARLFERLSQGRCEEEETISVNSIFGGETMPTSEELLSECRSRLHDYAAAQETRQDESNGLRNFRASIKAIHGLIERITQHLQDR